MIACTCLSTARIVICVILVYINYVNWTAVLENDGRATICKTGGGCEVKKENTPEINGLGNSKYSLTEMLMKHKKNEIQLILFINV